MPDSSISSRLDSREGYTLPSTETAKEFGKIVCRRSGGQIEIELTILMEPEGRDAEGWQTGVALDASASMKASFGRSLTGTVPPDLWAHYESQGWISKRTVDGLTSHTLTRPAYEDAIAKGHLRMTDNLVQPIARDFLRYLAANLDADGGTTLIYWACGTGSGIEEVGDPTEADCDNLVIAGPTETSFGKGTHLEPAIRYFTDRFADADRGMYVFITDGSIGDLQAVKSLSRKLCREIEAGDRNPLKFVLIGVGADIDESQMEELDDLDSGTSVDLWDHKVAAEMRSLLEIFAEVVDENQIVASTATIYDEHGAKAKVFADGLPARLTFELPATATSFDLEVGGRRIRQSLGL